MVEAVLVYRAQLGAKDVILKVAKGSGHNHLGEPAWPNEIFYVFPVVIAGASTTSIGLASAEPGEQRRKGGRSRYLSAVPGIQNDLIFSRVMPLPHMRHL